MAMLAAIMTATAYPSIPDKTPLTRAPFIMTHDAGSGYLGGGIVNAWTKTQSTGLSDQLECDARSFDARPLNDPQKGLVWHHGGVAVDYSFAQSVRDIKKWCAANPEELVLMTVWDCEGSGCMDAVASVAVSENVTNLKDCKAVETGMNYGDAKKLGALDETLSKYEGRERQLFGALQKKYGKKVNAERCKPKVEKKS